MDCDVAVLLETFPEVLELGVDFFTLGFGGFLEQLGLDVFDEGGGGGRGGGGGEEVEGVEDVVVGHLREEGGDGVEEVLEVREFRGVLVEQGGELVGGDGEVDCHLRELSHELYK